MAWMTSAKGTVCRLGEGTTARQDDDAALREAARASPQTEQAKQATVRRDVVEDLAGGALLQHRDLGDDASKPDAAIERADYGTAVHGPVRHLRVVGGLHGRDRPSAGLPRTVRRTGLFGSRAGSRQPRLRRFDVRRFIRAS